MMVLLFALMGFYLRKILTAYYRFWVLYVFPFPNASHGPIGSGRDNDYGFIICIDRVLFAKNS